MTTADIAELPVAEKLLLMERLWSALRGQAGTGATSAWQKDVPAEPLRRLASGNEPVSPWAEAKERIHARTKTG